MPPVIAADAPVLERHDVTVTYLEQTTPHFAAIAPPASKVALIRMKNPPLAYYRYLFDAIGAPHHWASRRYLSDEDLSALINGDNVQIFGLYKEGWLAGFVEFDLDHPRGLEIKFLGLVPEAQGARLGPWFFQEVLHLAWAMEPKSVVIETCTLDNPAALRLYQRAGFTPYKQANGIVEWRG